MSGIMSGGACGDGIGGFEGGVPFFFWGIILITIFLFDSDPDDNRRAVQLASILISEAFDGNMLES